MRMAAKQNPTNPFQIETISTQPLPLDADRARTPHNDHVLDDSMSLRPYNLGIVLVGCIQRRFHPAQFLGDLPVDLYDGK
jgi:hypothetical protein